MKRFAATVLLVAAACAHYPVNPPLASVESHSGYRYANLNLPRIDDTFVVLAFSGGGSRAAGFSYGVLRELQNTKMPNGRSMLDYIDVISSVSGGSFTAMQFGLKGADGLDEFKTRFLDRDIQGMLLHAAVFSPRNWIRLLSPNFHRIDLAQEIYDRELFDNADFATLLAAQQHGRPLIIANATQLEMGARFEWTQDQFDPICSDLSKVHVSRAVAASSAFPGLLSPMVVRSYAGRCSYREPTWVANARADEAVNPERTRLASELDAYVNPRRQFLHLMDGGIADNIGLRGPLHALISTDTFSIPGFTIRGALNRGEIKNLLYIVVTAEPDSTDVRMDAKSRLPNLIDVIYNVINTPMGNYSFDTINLLRQTFQMQRFQAETDTGMYAVVVSFPLVTDPSLRARLNAIPTNFSLKPGQLDDLVAGSGQVLRCSAEYRKFVAALGGTANACNGEQASRPQ